MRGPDTLEAAPPGAPSFVDLAQFDALIAGLRARGYTVVGPTKRDSAIVYDELTSAADLPAGWTDEQAPGTYRLTRRPDAARFGFTVGPHAWKRFLHPSVLRLVSARRSGDGPALEPAGDSPPRYAFVGVRACELAAIERQDQVFLSGPFVDHHYEARRDEAFIVAVQCTKAGGTCFCASMGTGPHVRGRFDVSLTELPAWQPHGFVVVAGTKRGAELLGDVPHREATGEEIGAAEALVADAAAHMGRTLETDGLKDALLDHLEHPRWDDVASRCLTCGNCTMACPTCFCTTIDDTMSLAGDRAERWRKWDTCFSVEFSYMGGGSVRLSPRSRYRQWLTHKLANWHDQFGVSGCVGCGRCITWCPVGIDITVEARAIREAAGATGIRPETADDLC
jgi:ferredoxin